MLLYVLLAGCFAHNFAEIPQITVPQNTVATLPCPHGRGEVTWSRFINGVKVTLVSIRDGRERDRSDKRFGSLANNSLVILNVQLFDSAVYLCNGKQTVYLKVTTDPSAADVLVTPRNDGLGFGPGPGAAGDADAENQQSSDFWKVPVGVVVGAALVLVAIVTLRFCSGKKAGTNANLDKTVNEVIYEEIEAGEERPRRDSDVESPYYWTSISETPSTPTPPNNNLYSTVNKLKTAGSSSEECVYYLAQNPPQTGSVVKSSHILQVTHAV